MIKVKKLHPDAKMPEYATYQSAGFDLSAIEDVEIPYGQTKLVRTGLALQIESDNNLEIQIRPRSGLSLKTPIRIANSPGTIDQDYTGEVMVIVENASMPTEITYVDDFSEIGRFVKTKAVLTGPSVFIKKGDRIAQAVVASTIRLAFREVEALNETDRGNGGFGSTGK